MKIKEMQEICNKAQPQHGCINCKLWSKDIPGGCLKNHRYDVSLAYQNAKLQNNDVLANKIQRDYEELERKVLGE